jgi:Domain of unknown function (DUF4394)
VLVTVPAGIVTNALVRTYTLDPSTGAATFVGSIPNTVSGAGDYPLGMDVNPSVDRIRMALSNDENFRINPNTGSLAGDDPALNPAGNQIIAAAYDRNFDRLAPPPPTTLYEVSRATSSLMLQGGIDGAGPGGANGGMLTTVGALGITLTASSDGGLDISPNTGTAFATLHRTGSTVPRLYTIDLATGAATEVGAFPIDVTDLTILPNPPAPSGGGTTTDGSSGGEATAPPTVLPPIVDGVPLASLTLPKRARIATALKGKLKVGFTCDRACTAVAKLIAGKGNAAATTTLATGRSSLAAAGTGSIKLEPTRTGKKALRRARKRRKNVSTTVTLAVTDSAGAQASPVSRRLSVKR